MNPNSPTNFETIPIWEYAIPELEIKEIPLEIDNPIAFLGGEPE